MGGGWAVGGGRWADSLWWLAVCVVARTDEVDCRLIGRRARNVYEQVRYNKNLARIHMGYALANIVT
jgi:hypothetical protein